MRMGVTMDVKTPILTTDDIRITPEILSIIGEIDEFKGCWKAVGGLPPERLNALRRIATMESIGASMRIEGSTLSNRDIERLLAELENKPVSTHCEQEVVGYAEVMGTIFQAWREIPVTQNHIKQLHRDLLRHSEKDERHRGDYKKLKNSVVALDVNGRQLAGLSATASPFDTPRFMTELVAWFLEAEQSKRTHPLLLIATFVAVFLEIHPFQDANGRLSRLLTTLLLLRAGYAFAPYSSLDVVIESRMEGYCQALRKTQSTIRTAHPKLQPWILFFLRAIRQQVRNLVLRIDEDDAREIRIPATADQIVGYVRLHGRVTIAEMARASGVSRNTLKDRFRRLVGNNHLVRRGHGKGSWYSLP